MDNTVLHKEEEDRKKGLLISLIIHALIFLLCLFPYFHSIDSPDKIGGILVSLGDWDAGNNSLSSTYTEEDEESDADPIEESVEEDKSENKPLPPEEKVEEPTSKAKEVKKELTQETVQEVSEVVASVPTKEIDENAEKAKEAKEKARLEAARIAEEKAKEAAFNSSKSKFSDLLGSGSGNNASTGNQGDPSGDPDSKALNNIAKGSGRIGGGLTNRDVIYEPLIDDNSQKQGKVVIKVCVDSNGKVIEAKFTQRGSTTTDKYLVEVAEKGAKKYRFSPSDVETQCGSITVDFKLK